MRRRRSNKYYCCQLSSGQLMLLPLIRYNLICKLRGQCPFPSLSRPLSTGQRRWKCRARRWPPNENWISSPWRCYCSGLKSFATGAPNLLHCPRGQWTRPSPIHPCRPFLRFSLVKCICFFGICRRPLGSYVDTRYRDFCSAIKGRMRV